MKTSEQLVAAIDAIGDVDPEHAHGALDSLLIEQMPPEIKLAVMRLQARCTWWAYA